ncbi:hypothetical protein [Paraburkholderia sp. D1E]|uniref:hypothetical protein n=1 Tax=Paraburkholderia sp. D1E TaxID=3461398 RepID=UPI0040458016
MPDDVLVSLIERAPVYESHGITTRKDFEGFFARSLAETFAPVLGRLGYLPTLPLAANYIAPHLELPLTGYSTGAPTMFMTVNTMAFEEGLRKYYIGQLDTQHLPLSVQSRYDDFRKNAVPPEVLTEMYRQIPRVMTTLIPAFNAMRKGELLNQKAVVLNDVYADSASFAFADLIPVVATAVSETMFKNHADAGRGLEAPTHGELSAHQPIDILEHRLSNHEKGWFKSIGEAGNAMTKGLGEALDDAGTPAKDRARASQCWITDFGRACRDCIHARQVQESEPPRRRDRSETRGGRALAACVHGSPRDPRFRQAARGLRQRDHERRPAQGIRHAGDDRRSDRTPHG